MNVSWRFWKLFGGQRIQNKVYFSLKITYFWPKINRCTITSMLVFSSGEELVSERSICWCRMYQFFGTMFQNFKFYPTLKRNEESDIVGKSQRHHQPPTSR